ncbi:MAG: endonuclease/exonuclease/phosphatase family protein [Planctomycetota bacterium]
MNKGSSCCEEPFFVILTSPNPIADPLDVAPSMNNLFPGFVSYAHKPAAILIMACLLLFQIPLSAGAQTLRICSYNLQDKPVNSSDDADIRNIINGIGDLVVLGSSRNIDLLAFQEGPENPNTYFFLEADFEIVYGGNFEFTFATADPAGCRTGFVYNADKLVLLDSTSIDNMGFTHRPCVATFQPVGGGDADIFTVISIHLKAGSNTSDFNQREFEADQLASVVSGLPTGRPVIFAGDLNLKGSDEDAWLGLTTAGVTETVNTPIGLRSANWNNNIAFHPFHTQDATGANGGMDDRFDLLLISPECYDDHGFEYVKESLAVFGNNGTHSLDGSVATGNAVSSSVENSLIGISDHLPVIADFDWGVFRTSADEPFSSFSSDSFTIRQSGPVTSGAAANEVQVEGTSNGGFASFGVVDFDLSGIVQTGTFSTRVDDVLLAFEQVNQSFTRDGPVGIYIASPAASNVTINSSVQFQSGNNGLACVPASLSVGAELITTYPSVHHFPSGSDLPDGTLDRIALPRDTLRAYVNNGMNFGSNVRLILVPVHPATAATYAGESNTSFNGPFLSGMFDSDSGRKPHRQSPIPVRGGSVFDK